MLRFLKEGKAGWLDIRGAPTRNIKIKLAIRSSIFPHRSESIRKEKRSSAPQTREHTVPSFKLHNEGQRPRAIASVRISPHQSTTTLIFLKAQDDTYCLTVRKKAFFEANCFLLRKMPVPWAPKYVAIDDTILTNKIDSLRGTSCTLHNKRFHSTWHFWKPPPSAYYNFDYKYNELVLMDDACRTRALQSCWSSPFVWALCINDGRSDFLMVMSL